MADQDTKPWEDFQQQETKPWEDFGGGTAVAAPPTADTGPSEGAKLLEQTGKAELPVQQLSTWQAINTPITHFFGTTFNEMDKPYRQAAEILGGGRVLTPEEETKAAETSTPLEKGVRGVQAGAGDVIDSFLTPLGIATLGAGGLPKVAQRLIAGTFAAQMATQLPGQYSELKKAVKEGDIEKSSRLATELLGSAAMTGMAGKHALTRGATVPGTIRPEPFTTPETALGALSERSKATLPPELQQAATVLPRTAAEAAKIPQLFKADVEGDARESIARIMQKFGVSRDEAVTMRLKGLNDFGLIKDLAQQPETEVQNASGKQETAEVHGDVQSQPGGVPREVPEPQGVGGVQSQTGGGLRKEGENPPTGAQPESHAVETARLSAQPASEFAGAKGSAEAAKAFGERATTQAHIDALKDAETAASVKANQERTVGARAAALRKKQFFTEAIRAADDKITDTAIAQRAKTNEAQGKDERAIMENPKPVKLDDILASETGKVDVGGKPTSLTRASWNAIASEIKADPSKASEVIQKWGKQLSEAEKYKVTEPTPEAMRRGMHPQVLREGLMSIATHGDALGLDDATRREAWKAAHPEGVQTGKEAIPNAQEEKGKKEGVLNPPTVQPAKSVTGPAAPVEIPHTPLSHVEGEIGTIKLKSEHKGTFNDAYSEAYAKLLKKKPRLFSPTGSAPDQVVQSLNDAGFKKVTTDNLFDVLLGNHDERVKLRSGTTPESKADKFQKAIKKADTSKTKQVLSVGDLSVGDEFSVGGEKFKVTAIDPDTGEVTANDGKKFGSQVIPDGADIPADKGSVVQQTQTTEFVPPEKPGAQPKLGQGQNQGDLITSTQTEPFALTGEKGTDAERLQAAKDKAARDAAEAKAIQDRQQQNLLPPGPGAATRPDLVSGPDLPVNPGNPDIYGVAERVREQRARAGQVAPVEPGQGISAPDSVEKGRALLQSGADPEKILSDFEKTKRLSADDMAVVRAHGEQLAGSARRIEEMYGTDSDEYRAAWQELSDWDARSKTMQTEWHKTGQAQQGETDIDTGSFTGLQRAYSQKTGKDFTPGQASKAQATAKAVTQADAKAATAQQQLFEALDRQAVSEVAKPGSKASDPARRVWSRVRDYIKLGKDNFDDIRNKVATDLGMSVDEVTRMMSNSGKVKQLSDNVWRTQQTARRLRERARNWVTAQATPKLIRALQAIPRVLFSLKVGFHGTVALGTHAPMVAYQPPFWKMYAQNFGRMYRMVGSHAYYEHQVQDLIRKPNYITARRAGLVNDPYMYEDYTSPQTAAYFGKITGMGNRGYSVLKMLRQDMFDKHWNDLPESTKSPEVAKAIADGVNHATGVVKGRAPKGANLLLFAPRLEASRVAWLAVDPAKAGATFAHWKTATPAEKVFAINQTKEKAWVAGTMFGLLALNQGILSATGSKQKVNISDPMKSDFLKFKVGGMDVSYGNPMITMARLPIRLNALRQKGGSGKLAHLIYPDESMSSEAFKYVRTQLSPFANLAADIGFKGDYENRPLPKMPLSGPKLPMPKRLAARGEKAYTWPELTLEQVLPIPAEEAVKDVWKKGLGMSDAQVKAYGKAFAKALFMGATGARLNEDYNKPKEGPGW